MSIVTHSRRNNEMRPLRNSINVTLDACCHHEAGMAPDEESMRYWTAEMERADALIFGLRPSQSNPALSRWSGEFRSGVFALRYRPTPAG